MFLGFSPISTFAQQPKVVNDQKTNHMGNTLIVLRGGVLTLGNCRSSGFGITINKVFSILEYEALLWITW